MIDRIYALEDIKKPSYKAYLLHNYILMVEDKDLPNVFHRFMQRLCFGVRWEKIK